jgi:hypothetical protein
MFDCIARRDAIKRADPVSVGAVRHRPALRISYALVALAALAAAREARGDGPAPEVGIWRVRSQGPLTVDGGLALAQPAALGTGLSTGVGAGASYGRRVALGLRASWSTATESSLAWQVTQADFKLRATAALQGAVGRGRFALRLGAGPTIVHETRLRNQGMRAGLTGADLQTSATATLPAGDLEGVVAIHIAGPWLLTMSGGPTLTILDGGAHLGWTALIGTGWQP